MKQFIIVASMLLALGGLATVASADHNARGWADHYFEDLQRNGS